MHTRPPSHRLHFIHHVHWAPDNSAADAGPPLLVRQCSQCWRRCVTAPCVHCGATQQRVSLMLRVSATAALAPGAETPRDVTVFRHVRPLLPEPWNRRPPSALAARGFEAQQEVKRHLIRRLTGQWAWMDVRASQGRRGTGWTCRSMRLVMGDDARGVAAPVREPLAAMWRRVDARLGIAERMISQGRIRQALLGGCDPSVLGNARAVDADDDVPWHGS